MRLAVACFLLALVAFGAQTLVWSRLAAAPAEVPASDAVLASFARDDPGMSVDIALRYRGRPDLLEPRAALPSWHRADRDEAVRVHAALTRCPAPPLEERPTSAALAKAYAWHAATCAGTVPESAAAMIQQPPFVHPSGRSYAALARALGATPSPGDFHVLELPALDRAALSAEERALADLPVDAWLALARGDALVLTESSLVGAEHGPLGLSRLTVHARATWERHANRAGLALAARSPSATCAYPASPVLCWEPLTASARYARLRAGTTWGSLTLLAASALALGLTVVRLRRRAHADRIHVLRTLTHELRTPATSLKLDIEPLRAAYDDLPTECQEPLLRLSDGIERLHRVLYRSARYLALFETTTAPRRGLVAVREVPSTRELFERFAEEWPEGVTIRGASADGPVVTDPEWLGVALRNLVENAARHGTPPVEVTWNRSDDALLVRVADRGSTARLSLRRATHPFERAPESEGLGLGLAIVARVAQLLGGKLSHEPSPTVFQLRLPRPRGAA